ncbi:MAG: GNAT family N-acetyltransferase [Bdellovibrionales bacterium]|nr:GNAT family N-acetyltransferase [Bdellovibrionales bacterium]
MTEAVNPLMNYAFENLGFDKLVFANALGNQRSRRIKEKTGAKFVEVKPAKFVDPKFTEHEIWELKKVDWVNYQNRAIFYLRKANETDFEEIFMMGFDVWSDGQIKTDYLKECHESPKYKKGQWWVLEDGQKTLLCSAITYDFGHSNWGIGSLATPANLRKQGFASELLKKLTLELFNKSTKSIFLYADISPRFYEKHGFVSLPKEFQKYQSSTCMIKADSPEKIWSEQGFESPNYF